MQKLLWAEIICSHEYGMTTAGIANNHLDFTAKSHVTDLFMRIHTHSNCHHETDYALLTHTDQPCSDHVLFMNIHPVVITDKQAYYIN